MQQKKISLLKFPATLLAREYGSNIYISKEGKTDRIQFRSSIIYAGKFMEKYNIFHLYKHNIYINGVIPDDHSYRLAHECNKSFYPLIIFTSTKGELVGLRNDTVRNNWRKQKGNITREFVGEAADQYIRETENRLNNDDKILDLINKDIFFHAFFSLKYDSNLTTQIHVENRFPLIPFKNSIKAKGIQKIVFEDDGTSNAIQEGEFIDIKGDFKLNYELDERCLIDSIDVSFSLKKDNGEEQTGIKMKSYYLREYPLNTIIDEDTIALGESILKEHKKMHKKSIWSRFNDYLNSPI